jgi:F-box/leucine-rich repeat protein 2/20
MVNFACDPKVGDEGFLALSRHCPDFEGGNLNFTVVTDKAMIALAESCSKLSRLTLKHNENITNESVLAFAQHCPLLQSLDLGTIDPGIGGGMMFNGLPDPVSPVTSSALNALIMNCAAIHAMDLSDCCDIDSTVKMLADKCPLLKWLVFTRQGNVSEDTLVAIAEACPLMTLIDVQKCACVTDRSVCSLAEHCPKLTSLDFTKSTISDKSLLRIADHCSELNELVVNWCNVSASALVEVTAQCPRMIKLHCFNVPFSHQILLNVVVNCPFLVDLAISEDRSVPKAVFEAACKQIDSVFPRAVLACMGMVPDGMIPN